MNTIIKQFISVFPADLSLALKENPAYFDGAEFRLPTIFQGQVMMIRALSSCFGFPEAADHDFIAYVDKLFCTLLSPKVDPVLQAEVVQSLTLKLPFTNRSRARVEKKFRRRIMQLFWQLAPAPERADSEEEEDEGEEGDEDKEDDEASEPRDKKEAAPAKDQRANKNSVASKHLLEEIYRFLNRWYVKPSDQQIQHLSTREEIMSHITDGYCYRRYQWLQSPEKLEQLGYSGIHNEPDSENVSDDKAPILGCFFFEQFAKKKCEIFGSANTANDDVAAESPIVDDVEYVEDNGAIEKILSMETPPLTFNISPPTLLFNRYPFRKEIYLQNKTSNIELHFNLQTSPAEFFFAEPSFGNLLAGESVLVTIDFRPQPHSFRKSPEVQGFLRVRTREGLPLERLALKAFNMPAIRSFPETVKFGYCPIHETRKAVFTLQNLLPIDCPSVMIIVPTPGSEFFSLTPSQVVLTPKERRNFSIKFTPSFEDTINATLIVIAFGGEIHRLHLHAICGQPLRILDPKLDFGPTDIYYDKVLRRIHLENKSNQPHRICWESSSNEIIANNGKSINCKPGESLNVETTFLSTMTGQRNEFLQFFAGNTVFPPVDISAFSGPAVSLPMMEEIFFPTTQTSQPASVMFPITNLSNTLCQCLVSIPPSAPFTIQLMDPETANRKTLEKISLIVEAKPFEGPDSLGVLVTIGPRLTAVLEIVFLSSTWGTFRVPLTTMMVKPRKLNIATHYISAVAVNEVYLSRESPVDMIRRFLKSPKSEQSTGLMLKRTPDKNNSVPVSVKTSDVLDIDPIPQLCLRLPKESLTDQGVEFITLSNLSVAPQKYHIALSFPFSTPIPLDGVLESLSSIDIPIDIDVNAFDSTYERELKGKIAIGQITIFDENQKMGMVSGSIHGAVSELVGVEVREDTSTITFPSLRVMEKHSRKIFIHNKAPFEVIWEGRFTTKATAVPDGFGQQAIADWCPFGLNSTRINLKPYEYGTIDIVFQATSSGNYKAMLTMDYIDPIQRIINNEKQRTRTKKQLMPLEFQCQVGVPEVDIDTNIVNFGDVPIEEIERREIQFTNDQTINANVIISTPQPFSTSDSVILVPKSSTFDLELMFQSVTPKSFYEIFVYTCGRITKTIPVMATSGISKLTSNLASPIKVSPMSNYNFSDSYENLNHCIDFGVVNPLAPKSKVFRLRNMGTFEYLVKNIALGDDGHLSWKFSDESEQTTWKTELNDEFWDYSEMDWDEIDFKAKDERLNSGAGVLLCRGYKAVLQSGSAETTAEVNFILIDTGDSGAPQKLSNTSPTISNAFPQPNVRRPALQIWDKKLEFGIKAVHSKHQGELKFSNTATIPLSWSLKLVKTKCLPIKRFDPLPLPKNEATIPCPVQMFPISGKLYPGCTQAVDIIFSPSLPQYEIFTYLSLQTEDFAETPITIHGIGASSRLIPDKSELDFGVLRVGTQREFKIKLRNRGILQTRYFVESGNSQFASDPEQGLLEGDGSVDISVRFAPKTIGQIYSALRILPQSAESYRLDPIVIKLLGMGSYPELVVHTKVVDFGTALFGSPNSKAISVENKGAAEARIIFTCHHPAVRLEGGNNGDVLLPPNSKQEINIIYTPQVVEYLDVKVFLKSSDSRGDYFMLQVKGSVGVPKLTLEPMSILQELDFGVCSVNSRHTKSFNMKNEGNISLTYKLLVERLDVVLASEKKKTVVQIEPNEGVLGVGETQLVKVSFCPEDLQDYKYRLTMAYDFRSLTATIRGVGGRAILRLESPLRTIDFGVCRLNRIFRKSITVSNAGNLGVDFHVRPERAPTDWDDTAKNAENASPPLDDNQLLQEETSWEKELAALGFRILNPDSHCKPYSQANVIIEYEPVVEALVSTRLRVYFGVDSEDIEIRGRAAVPKLSIYSASNELLTGGRDVALIDLGVHPVNSEYVHVFQMTNDSPFGIDYLVQPVGIREFEVLPLRGFIEPTASAPLKLFFRPNSESKFQMLLKVLWEREPLKINISGSGGIGKLEISYIDEKDIALKGLDFGMIPFNSASEKRFFLYNIGLVPITVNAEVDHDEYTITQIGEPFASQKQAARQNKRTGWNWHNALKATLLPSMGVELSARFIARSPTTSMGSISIKSECRDIVIPMRGKGGTIAISHKGELGFGDIASNFTYNRKIVISNNGSIPATLNLEWLIVGHTSEPASSHVKLAETYSALDPRSGWARTAYLKERGITDATYKLSAKDHWKLIAKLIRKGDAPEAPESSRIWGGLRGNPSSNVVSHTPVTVNISTDSNLGGSLGTESGTGIALPFGGGPFSTGMETRSRLTSSQSSYSVLHGKKGQQNHYSTLFKRRQMLFHLVTNTQLSSQSVSNVKPYLKVEPGTCTLPSFGEVTVHVDIHLSTEDTFLATLLVKANVPNTPNYEIPLTATPKAVSIMCDDTRTLNFFRQPLGESEVITRTFTNIGHKDINYKFTNTNMGLIVVPSKGILKVGQKLSVQFIFRPMDENLQTSDVVFEPDCSQPVRLKMNGAGGFAKASLAKYRRFDFGHCMIGKDTTSLLPITNEGNAILHLTRFDLYETDTFFKGMDWPGTRVSLFPGETFNLAIVFNPHEESPAPGKLVIGTNTESWEIELIGLGREAVLIVSKVALEFTECLIGNSYERKLGLKNVGDVNYPVTFKLEKEFPDLEFIPESLVINPFSENYVIVSYTPTKETKSTVVMTISSPYSIHKVPVLLHAGTAILEFSEEEIDFGMFERVSRPSTKLTVKNVGTVKTSYSVKDMAKPSMFQLSNSKGLLLPGRSAEVVITHIRHEVCEFTERLIIRSDLIDKFYYIRVKGQCEEALLKPDEFSLLSMGICPVLESTTKQLSFTNYGRFPLEYSVKSAYPLKVMPTFGVVAGGDAAVVNVSWNPSGGYELRTQITLVTNIGNFNVIVRGKAAFPELAIKNMYLDFGVCAVGHSYVEKFTLTNKGKVPLHFNIPPLREICYSVSSNQGYLHVKESLDIDVAFKPNGIGRFANSFIVECKGISYKEIVVVGIGGQMKLDISPPVLDIELGIGVKIILTKRSRKILESENLAVLAAPGPFGRDIELGTIDDNLKKFTKRFRSDLAIVEAIGMAMDISRNQFLVAETQPALEFFDTTESREEKNLEIPLALELPDQTHPHESLIAPAVAFETFVQSSSLQDPVMIPLPPSIPTSRAGTEVSANDAPIAPSLEPWMIPLPPSLPTSPPPALTQNDTTSIPVITDPLLIPLPASLPMSPIDDVPALTFGIKATHAPPLDSRESVNESASDNKPLDHRESVYKPGADDKVTSESPFATTFEVQPQPAVLDAETTPAVPEKLIHQPEFAEEKLNENISSTNTGKSLQTFNEGERQNDPVDTYLSIESKENPQLDGEGAAKVEDANAAAVTEPFRPETSSSGGAGAIPETVPSLTFNDDSNQIADSSEEAIAQLAIESDVLVATPIVAMATATFAENLADNILKELQTIMAGKGGLPTEEKVEQMADSFLELKRQNYFESANDENDENDIVISDILNSATLNIKSIDLSYFTDLVEPTTETDINIILERPPPFLKDEPVGKEDLEPKKAKALKYHEYMTLDRGRRNAKTVGFFR
ncbi:hypothetical protein HDU97_002082 [Phlyctochytrium planicorne]|nr:hypothetical protein HDU97_002082 [Phlyctochytrium planicorne]